MNPEQPAAPPSGNTYDFIVNPQRAGKNGSRNPIKNPLVLKLLVIVGGALVFMLLANFFVNLFFGDKTDYTGMTRLTQTQTEIARIANEGSKVNSQTVRNAAANTQLVIINQRNEWTSYLSKAGKGV